MAHSTIQFPREPSLSDYQKSPIGKGGQGQVYKYTHPTTGELAAVKVLKWKADRSNHLSITKEALISLHTDNDHVLRAEDVFTYNDGVAIVMPYFPLGDLNEVSPRLDVFQLKEAIRQILDALQYFHRQGQIHRDIKPQNVLVRSLDPLEVIVADFGMVSIANPVTDCGTAGYKAPEILQARETKNPVSYTGLVDIYALGVLLLGCLQVQLPPVPVLNEKLYFQVIGSTIESEMARCQDIERRGGIMLADKMLSYKPEERLSPTECLQASWLNHWSYVPYAVVPTEFRDLPQFECETRPTNNPIQALAIDMALEHYLLPNRRVVEFLAYVLTKGPRTKSTKSLVFDPTQEQYVAEILSSLPTPEITDVLPRPSYKQSDRLFHCVFRYFQKLGRPDNVPRLEKLAGIFANQSTYCFPNKQVDTPQQADEQIQRMSSSNSPISRKPPNRSVRKRKAPKVQEESPMQSPQAGNSAGGQGLVVSRQDRPEGIRNRLRSSVRRTTTDPVINVFNSDRMEICSKSKSSHRRSDCVENLALSDKMELSN